MQRRAHVIERSDPPMYLVVLDESVLHRAFGGAKVMAEQLEELAAFVDNPNMIIRVLPLAEVATAAMIGPFTVFDLGDEENAILYRESPLGDEITHTPGVVQYHRDTFERMWRVSLGEDASARRIRAMAASLLASMDNGT
jgi:hypothetical protein